MLHRHDISDKLWEKIGKKLPGSKGHTGRPAEDNRRFIMRYFGFCVQELLGGIFHLSMEIGKTLTGASHAGETKEFGKKFLRL